MQIRSSLLIRRRGVLAAVAAVSASAAVLRPARAQASAFPEAGRPIRWVVPFPPGGTSDVRVRQVAEKLRAELTELRDLRSLRESAAALLADGLGRAQVARSDLSKAISDRTDLPKRFDDDPAAMQTLLDSAETLDAFAAGLPPDAEGTADFAARKGSLPLPVQGTLLRRSGEADAAGVRRPGVTLATRPRALVTAPHPGTIRYRGPLLDYGNVMILEPGGGYLLVLAGLETVYGEVGEVVAEGTALGLMGGDEGTDGTAEFLSSPDAGGAVRETETLYMELRRGTVPEDPAPWFAAMGE